MRFVTPFVGRLPLEELLFFLVVPVCGILTFEAVRRLRPGWARGSSLADAAPAAPPRQRATGDAS